MTAEAIAWARSGAAARAVTVSRFTPVAAAEMDIFTATAATVSGESFAETIPAVRATV